ncbi:sulfotransferase family protein [Ferrimonas balearica]|uniref:sulfotransferase family protein n=1 Tax=Ferrimonas balearica TaxID=44012 RepID=UPI001C996812|nr:sulfotransferase [Ferrimonas balearica]MBY5921253.1 sulfotransferase [Ferrimonas balearica]MBY5996062.1 sulfotransferase [Ferrimonas balearica]
MFHYFVEYLGAGKPALSVVAPLSGHVETLDSFTLSAKVDSEAGQIVGARIAVRHNGQHRVSDLDWNGKGELKVALPTHLLNQGAHSGRYFVEVLLVGADGRKKRAVGIVLTEVANIPAVTFVVGSPRSGTTAVGNGIQAALQVESHGESHLAELYQSLVEHSINFVTASSAARNSGTLANAVTPLEMKALLLDSLRQLHRVYYGSQIIIDKTPGIPMIRALPLLYQLYPQAKVVFCRRRALENVASRLKKFPGLTFEEHCKQWRNTFHQWYSSREHVHQIVGRRNWFLMIEQKELQDGMEKEVARIARFLGFSEAQQQLMVGYLNHHSPEQTNTQKSVKSLEEMPWSDDEKALIKQICGIEMSRQGYAFGSDYYLDR